MKEAVKMNPQGEHRSRRDALWRSACALLVLAASAALAVGCPPAAAEDTIDLAGVWKFKGDWEEKGQVEGWQKSDFDDSQWQSLHVPGDWEEQGIMTGNPRWPSTILNDGYNGYAWYRRHFAVPAD